jgi:DNA-directed RNA polymerase subunit RPC12/RpoP
MGNGITVSCQTCSYKKTFMLGVGMAYSSLENVLDCVINKTVRAHIFNLLKNHYVNQEEFYRALFRCKNCDSLYERFYVELHYDDGQIFKTEFYCSKCEKPLTKVKNEEKRIPLLPCPNCRNKTLNVREDMLWD